MTLVRITMAIWRRVELMRWLNLMKIRMLKFTTMRHRIAVRQIHGLMVARIASPMVLQDIAGVVLSMKTFRLVVVNVPVVWNLAFFKVGSWVVLVEVLGIIPPYIPWVTVLVGVDSRHMVAMVVLWEWVCMGQVAGAWIHIVWSCRQGTCSGWITTDQQVPQFRELRECCRSGSLSLGFR